MSLDKVLPMSLLFLINGGAQRGQTQNINILLDLASRLFDSGGPWEVLINIRATRLPSHSFSGEFSR